MCGIAGLIRRDGAVTEEDAACVARMTHALRHRGPDGSGLFRSAKAVLGHRRLSIIDLTAAAAQPLANEDGKVRLVFNGEIYNFRKLREELVGAGHRFASRTDSEALVHGYEEWGMDGLLTRLRGMYAFALLDARGPEERLFLARDRFGIKPLYYYRNRGACLFASEVRALRDSKAVPNRDDEQALWRFLLAGSVPEPLTTVEKVRSLPAGSYVELGAGRFEVCRYYSLEEAVKGDDGTDEPAEPIAETRRLLDETVTLHLISDAPLGVFLSGGIDSSALVALASQKRCEPLTTVSVVFDEADLSEAQYARLVAENCRTDHRETRLRRSDFFEALPQVFAAMDQPTVDGVNTFFVSRAARQAGLKAVLSGLGSDEIFMGYRHFRLAGRWGRSWRLFSSLPHSARSAAARTAGVAGRALGKTALARKADYLSEGSSQSLYWLYRGLFSRRQARDLLGGEGVAFEQESNANSIAPSFRDGPEGPLERALTYHEFDHYLKNQLLKDADFMSMHHSVEVRVPFLDHLLVERVTTLPTGLKLDRAVNKPVLVRALGDDLPQAVWERPKMGFTLPFEKWIRDCGDDLRQRCRESGLFNQAAVDRVWDSFEAGKAHWSLPWALVAAACFRRG